jgi:hypothetical protein
LSFVAGASSKSISAAPAETAMRREQAREGRYRGIAILQGFRVDPPGARA